MTDSDLKRLVQSVGQSVFVRYFGEFSDSVLSNQEVADLLPHKYTAKSRLSRTSHARSIIKRGLVADALELIRSSKRADAETIRAAEALLRSEQPN